MTTKLYNLLVMHHHLSLSLSLSSGMFFDGNHTYMIEPGGENTTSVSIVDHGIKQSKYHLYQYCEVYVCLHVV